MKLSIIVPVYNAEKYLKQCLDSILDQTMKDFEIICVDDGSTDDSIKILQDYAQNNDNIIIISQKNQGPGVARNKAIEKACGEFIGFVDADDYIDKQMYSVAIDAMEKNDADICILNPYIYEDTTQNIYPYRNMLDFYRLSVLGAFSPADQPKVFSFLGCWDKIYRKQLLVDNGIKFPSIIYEDHLFSYLTLAYAKKIVVLKDSYYYYRKCVGTSITDNEKKNDKYKKDFLTVIREIKKTLIEKGCYESVAPVFLKYVLFFGMFHNANSTTKTFFKDFFNSMSNFLDENDYKVIKKLNIKKYNWYASVLKENKMAECRRKITSMMALSDFVLDEEKKCKDR